MIIIDEVFSVVSSLNLRYAHLHLKSCLVVVSGLVDVTCSLLNDDLLQLQPVNGKPVFKNVTRSTPQ